MTSRHALRALIVLLALACTACGDQVQQAKQEARQRLDESVAKVGDTVNQALGQAREKLQNENLTLGGGDRLPKAEVTPQGELLVNGVAVPLSEEQRNAMLAYREQLLALADAGMNLGAEGAQLAGQAVSQVAGLLDGNVEEARAKLEAEAQRMAGAGLKLCEQAKGLEATQQQLAALIPEFAPYIGALRIDADCEGAAQALNHAATAESASAQTEGTPGS